jgi:hypothetical protein
MTNTDGDPVAPGQRKYPDTFRNIYASLTVS